MMRRRGADRLVEQLLIDDREHARRNKKGRARVSVAPKKAIDELARGRESAIPALIPLVEKYEREEEQRLYAGYAAEVLGRIRTDMATELLLRILRVAIESNDRCTVDGCDRWLRNRGRSAIPAFLKFIDANYGAEPAVVHAVRALRGTRDRRVGSLMVTLLEHPSSGVIEEALLFLQEQDDPSFVPRIIPLLRYADGGALDEGIGRSRGEASGGPDNGEKRVRDATVSTLEKLLRNDPRQLRKVLLDNQVLSAESIRDMSKEIVAIIDDLASSYEKGLIFKGDEGDRLTALVKDKVAKENSSSMMIKVARLLYHEGLVPSRQFEAILRRCSSLSESAQRVERENAEVFWLAGYGPLMSPVWITERRQVRTSNSNWPELVGEFRPILHSRGFAVSESEFYTSILARSREKDRTVIISLSSADGAEGRGELADVRIRLCRDWGDQDAASILRDLWKGVDAIVPPDTTSARIA
jgi:hypothetical protein